MTTSVKTASKPPCAGELERLRAGAGAHHPVAELDQQGLGEGADLLIVVDEQDPAGAVLARGLGFGFRPAALRASLQGRIRVTIVPWPTTLSTWTSPPVWAAKP